MRRAWVGIAMAGVIALAGGGWVLSSDAGAKGPTPVAGLAEGHAEPAEPATTTAAFESTYRYAGGQAGRDAIDAAIEEAIAEMNPLIRGLARRKLAEANGVIPTLGFSLAGDPLIASYVGGRVIEAPADGSEIEWVDPFGDTIAVSHRYQSHQLVQVMSDSNGRRRNVYRFDPEAGTMSMSVTIEAPRLPAPLKYRLTYRKQ